MEVSIQRGDYAKAEKHRKMLALLKVQAKKKALDEMDQIHEQQRAEIKAAHNEDFQRFCREWEDNMTYYDLKALRIDVIKGMSAKKPKFSKWVLDNRVIESTL